MAFFSWHVVANYALSPVIATSPDSILAQIYQVRCLRFPGDLYHSKHTQGQVYSCIPLVIRHSLSHVCGRRWRWQAHGYQQPDAPLFVNQRFVRGYGWRTFSWICLRIASPVTEKSLEKDVRKQAVEE